MNLFKDFYQKKLNKIKELNLYRRLENCDMVGDVYCQKNGKKYVNFSSNDYLGMAQDARVKKAAIKAIAKYGVGAGASRYVSGNNSLYQKLEKKLAKIKNSKDAIVFGSGYLAAIGVISALVSKNDLIIADKLIHASSIDGARLSGAKFLRFAHNDVVHARELLVKNRKNYQKCLLITETIFSMNGDLGRVGELLELAQEFDCLLLSDDAHGLCGNYQIEKGFIIKSKKGFVTPSPHSCNFIDTNIIARLQTPSGKTWPSNCHLQLGTFSKAIGGYGGYVCGSTILIDYLRNFAKSAIYSTALPPAILAANLKALELIEKNLQLAKKALENAEYFCELLSLPSPQSAIVVIIIGDAAQTLHIAKKISEKKFLISAIRPPTVEAGKSRLRITFSALHKRSDIARLAKIIGGMILQDNNYLD